MKKMDPKFKKQITENLPKLIDCTICSSEFLAIFRSKSVFSKSDVELIQTEERNKGPTAACSKFYDLLSSRSGSFEVLLEALRATNQTGALSVFTKLSNYICTQNVPLKFASNPPQYITDYMNQQDGRYLIVCSNDCKLTCDWIMETFSDCTLCTISELLNVVTRPQENFDDQTILLTNLEENMDPIYTIQHNTQLKVVCVTAINSEQLNDKLKHQASVWGVAQEIMQWEDLSLLTKFSITSGLKQSLGLDGMEITEVLNSIDAKTLTDFLNDKFPTPANLFCDTIPRPIAYYIKRSLQTTHVISDQVFEENPRNDFILFSGIERVDLSNLCRNKLIESSSTLLRTKKAISKFIFLENKLDFESISNMFPEYAVHLLEYKKGELIWKKTKGNIRIMQKHGSTKQRTLTETEFLSEILDNAKSSPICISDTPGKGKSILLAQLARDIKLQSTGIVAFIVIKDLIQFLKDSTEVTDSIVLTSVCRFFSTSNLGCRYLNANKKYLCELMLDGFDEIDADDTEFALYCVKRIRSVFNETRIRVTSRPHMLSELEKGLKTLGYNITPFTKSNQISFLASYWSHRMKGCHSENLSAFAEKCLELLDTSLRPSKEVIAGIPLQCKLIGEVYEEDAKRFLTMTFTKTPAILSEVSTVTGLYQRLIERKLEKFNSRYNVNNFKKPEIMTAHIHMALELLHPLYVTKFSDMLLHNMSRQEIFDFGLIKAKSVFSTFEFLHRTFAEYFVALFVSEALSKYPSNMLIDFVLEDVMMTSQTHVYFVDHHVSCNRDILRNMSFPCSQFRHNVTCYFLNSFLKRPSMKLKHLENARPIAEACVYHNLENLFTETILFNKFKQDIINEALLIKAVYLTDVHFLSVVTVEYSSKNDTPLLKISCHRLHHTGEYLKDDSNIQASFTLLHLAMKKADFATVDFLMKKYFWDSVKSNHNGTYNDLIWLILQNSVSNGDRAIQEQRLIIQYLASINKDLLVSFPLQGRQMHLDLILEVWKLAKPFYSKINTFTFLLGLIYFETPFETFYKFLTIVFSDLGRPKIEKVIGRSTSWNTIGFTSHPNNTVLDFLKDQCSSLLSPVDQVKIFKDTLKDSSVKKNIFHWFLQNLSYSTENIRQFFIESLRNVNESAINALLDYVQRHKSLERPPVFHEMFEFLFGGERKSFLKNVFTIVQMVNFFILRDYCYHFQEMAFGTTLTQLESIGFSYFEELLSGKLVSMSYAQLLKLVWITKVCSKFKRKDFVSKVTSYYDSINIQSMDVDGNTLLHIFALHFSHGEVSCIQKSFLDYVQFSKGFKFKCGDDIRDLSSVLLTQDIDVWKLLVKNQLDILQCNINNQTPICLLSKHFFCLNAEKLHQYVIKAILFAANQIKAQNNRNIQDIHQVFYLVTKSHNISVVQKVYEWYSTICESQKIAAVNVKVAFGEETGNFLDAAIRNGSGSVYELIENTLKIHIPLLPPPPLCMYHSIEICCDEYVNKTLANYIEYMAKIFPNEISQLVNQPNEKNKVPLSLATSINLELVKLLIDSGENVNVTDDDGNTPLHFTLMDYMSFELDQIDVIDQLIESGGNVNAQNIKGDTPLFLLAKEADLFNYNDSEDLGIKCFEMLVQNKADPCIQDCTGNTAIHYLAQNVELGEQFHRVVEILISNKFDDVLTMRNCSNETPVQLADMYLQVLDKTKQLLFKNGIFDLEV